MSACYYCMLLLFITSNYSVVCRAVFGYEGQNNVLKLVGKGDGGIEEMTEDLSGGKIQYAYCRVMDPNTNLPKFVFINWVRFIILNLPFIIFVSTIIVSVPFYINYS